MTEDEKHMRDLAAMFAMAALLIRNKYDNCPHEQAFKIADQFINERKKSGSNVQDE
jgi:anthranilate phosphoribosyltransferase